MGLSYFSLMHVFAIWYNIFAHFKIKKKSFSYTLLFLSVKFESILSYIILHYIAKYLCIILYYIIL